MNKFDRMSKAQLIQELDETKQRLAIAENNLLITGEVLKQMPDAIILTDLAGNIQKWEGFAEQIFGYPAGEAIGKPVNFIHRPDIKDSMTARIVKDIQETGMFFGEIPCVTKDGVEILIETTAKTVYDPRMKPLALIGINRDITQRKLAERALSISEARYRSLFIDSPISLWEEDLSGIKKYFDALIASGVKDIRSYLISHPEEVIHCANLIKVIDVNQATLYLYKASSKTELLARLAENRKRGPIETSQYDPFRTELLERLDGKIHFESEEEQFDLDGNKFFAYISTSVAPGYEGDWSKVFITVIDITERKRAEIALKASEERFHNIVENAGEIIYTVDDNGTLTFVSPAWTQLLGHPVSAVLGKSFVDFIHPDDLPRCAAFLEKVRSTGKPQRGIEYRVKHRDGSWRWHTTAGSVAIVSPGQTPYYVGVAQDITEKKKVEDTLRESEERYRTFVKNFQGIAYRGGMDYRPIFFHGAVEKITGYQETDFLEGKPSWDDVIVPMDLDKITADYPKFLIPGYSTEREYRITHRDGKIRWVHELLQGIFDNAGNLSGFQGAIYDITERKQAEEALFESQQRFKILSEASFEGIGFTEKGVLLDLNQQILDLLGYDRTELIGKTVMDVVAPESRAFVAEAIRSGRIDPYEHVAIRKDGTKFHVEVRARFAQIGGKLIRVSAIRDITERKRAEDVVQRRANELSTLNAFGQAVSSTLSMEQVVQVAVDGFASSTQSDITWFYLQNNNKLELQGTGPISSTYKRPKKLIRALGECISGLVRDTGKPVFSKNLLADPRVVCQSCQFAGLHSCAAFPFYNGDVLLGVIAMASTSDRDYNEQATFLETMSSQVAAATQNALLHRQVQQYAAELEQRVHERTVLLESANKELEAFSYSVSHDLRAPLRAISGFSRILLENHLDKLDDEGQNYLQRVSAASERMGHLIDDLLTLSRITRQDMSREKVNLSAIAAEIITGLRAVEPERDVTVSIAEDMKTYGDARLLRIVLENLLGNAWKFSSKRAQSMIEFNTYLQDGKPVYFIRDNGAGFDMKYADKLFGAFQRLHTTKEFEGTGIGLATVQRIIQRHHGKVWADSVIGQGATFSFSL